MNNENKLMNDYKIKLRKQSIRYKIVFFIITGILFLFIIAFISITLAKNVERSHSFDYSGMHRINIPLDNEKEGGSISIPNNWELRNDDGWYYLYDTSDNLIVGVQIYSGYKIDNEWVDYKYNSFVNDYNYQYLFFENAFECNFAKLRKNEKYYEIYIPNLSYFKSNDYKNRIYPFSFFFFNYDDEVMLKKIVYSYVINVQ